jgi:phage terminase small subunit
MVTEVLKRYSNYRSEIQEYMKYVVESLIERYGEISEHYIISLDILAMNLDIMYNTKKEMDTKGFQHEDHQGVQRKAGWIQQFNTSQQAVFKIMHDFGLNPMAASKIKDNKRERDIQKFIDSLSQ